MNRFFTLTSYALVVFGLLACIGGLISFNLTPLVLGGILVGLGGILLHLVRLEQRLGEALPTLNALAQNARYLALKESQRASDMDPKPDPSLDRPGLRDGSPGVVGAYPERSNLSRSRA